MKPKFRLEEYQGKKYVLHCPEEWQAETYKKFIDGHNLRYNDNFPSPDLGVWKFEKEHLCYNLFNGACGNKNLYFGDGYVVLEFEDFDWTDREDENDPVNHLAHYTDDEIEVIDFIENKKLSFARGNAVKCICRAGKDSSTEIEDLKEAIWYIQREIKKLRDVE